jgi:hypothetical protein
MNTLNEKLAQILANGDEADCAKSFETFCREHAGELPLPGVNPQFDKAMWTASKFAKMTKIDERILNRVTGKMLEQIAEPGAIELKLRDLVGSTKQAAIDTWQDLLAGMLALKWFHSEPSSA